MGVSQNWIPFWGSPYNDYGILGPMLSPPVQGNYHALPNMQRAALHKPLVVELQSRHLL